MHATILLLSLMLPATAQPAVELKAGIGRVEVTPSGLMGMYRLSEPEIRNTGRNGAARSTGREDPRPGGGRFANGAGDDGSWQFRIGESSS